MGHIDEWYDRDKRAVLGGGTYATVYAAKCRRSGRMVALKKLRRMAPPQVATGRFQKFGGGGGSAATAAAPTALNNGTSPLSFVFHAGEPGWPDWSMSTGGGGRGGGGGSGGAGGTIAVTDRGDATVDDRGGVAQAALREIKVLQELRHPHIVRLRETFAHKETLVLVFDYAAGGDLELLLYPSKSSGDAGAAAAAAGRGEGGSKIRVGGVDRAGRNGCSGGGGDGGEEDVTRPPLPPGVVKAHMKALLEALAYCHEQGVLHRDVKPNNLLLDDQGRLLLADFGLARYLPMEATGEEQGEVEGDTAGLAAPARAQETEEDDHGWRLSEEEGKGRRPAQSQPQLQQGQAVQGAEGVQGRCSGGARGGGNRVGGGNRCCANTAKDDGGESTGMAVAADHGHMADTLGGSCGGGGDDDDGGGDRSMNRWPMGQTTQREAGLCRDGYARPVMTHQIGMRWYRPPELLFGCRTYGGGVDVWAVGCVFAEMMLRRVWFQGNSDVDQLRVVFEVLGTPTEECWPGVTRLPNYLKFSPAPPKDLATIFPEASPDALDLLAELTRLCPERRPTARQALSHPYFLSDPPPTPPGQLPLAMTRVAMAAAARTAADAMIASAADHYCWDNSGDGSRAAAAGLKGGHLGGDRNSSRTGVGVHHAGQRESALLAGLPTFRAPAGQGHHGGVEGPLPRFQLPLPPSLPSDRLPAGFISFDSTAAATAGAGNGSKGVAWPLATQPPSFRRAFRLGQPNLEFPDLSSKVPPELFPLPGSSAADDVAAAVAAAGGSGNFPSSSGPPYQQPLTSGLQSRFQAILEDDVEGQNGADVAWRTSSAALPYDVAAAATQPPPLQHRQHRAPTQHWPAPVQAPLTADAAGSAPRRYRRCRRTQSSVATADMSISKISVAAAGMVGGRLCFDEVARRDATSRDTGGSGDSGNPDIGAELERAEKGEKGQEEEEDLCLVAEGIPNDEGEEIEAVDDEEEEDDFDGFRRCVPRRFSFGSSLATDGDVLATAAAAAAAVAAAAAAAMAPSTGGAMAITTVGDSEGTVSTGGASHHKGSDTGAGGGGGGDSVVPMATTTATTAAVGGHGAASAAVTAAGYDPMSVSFSMCGGGGGGLGTVGSKRPRPLRDFNNHQTLPPTPSALAAALAGADPDIRGCAHSCFHQAQPGSNGGGGDLGGMDDVRMHDRSAGSNGSIGGGASEGGCAAAAIPTASVTAAPSFTMLSASAAASASVNAAARGDGSGGGAAARGLMEAPPPRLRQSRTSDVTVAMLSFAGGIDGSLAMHAPPTAVGPRQLNAALGLEQPSVHGFQLSAIDSGGRDTGRSDRNAAALSGFPLLPLVAPRVGAAVTADVGVIAAAVAAAATAGGGDGGFGGDASGVMAAAAAAAPPAALSDSVHLRPGPSGVRPDSTDLQYLRQRKVEVDEALRQASQADDPPTQDDSDSDQYQNPHHHGRREVQGRPQAES